MEVKFENNFKINSGEIVGIVDQDNYFINYIKNISVSKPSITVDSKKLNKTDLSKFQNKISIIDRYLKNDYLNLTVYEYMKYVITDKFLSLKDYNKKIKDSLRIVGLGENYLDKKISLLSFSETKLILFAIGLLSNPDIIILDNFFNSLDIKNRKKILGIINQLAEQYHKIFIILSSNIDDIYKMTKKIVFYKGEEVLVDGDTMEIFEDGVELLLMNNIFVPESVEFSYKVNTNKNIKLGYFRDIRDLIKDIYKKV